MREGWPNLGTPAATYRVGAFTGVTRSTDCRLKLVTSPSLSTPVRAFGRRQSARSSPPHYSNHTCCE